MLPTIENRIANLIKAMQQVILPALPADAALAREQAQLVVGHLSVIAMQWPKALAYEAETLRGLESLGRALAEEAVGGEETGTAAGALETALAEEINRGDLASLQSAVARIGAAIDATILAAGRDGSQAFHAFSAEAVIAHGGRQARRERVWFAGTNLDPDGADLPSFESLFGR